MRVLDFNGKAVAFLKLGGSRRCYWLLVKARIGWKKDFLIL